MTNPWMEPPNSPEATRLFYPHHPDSAGCRALEDGSTAYTTCPVRILTFILMNMSSLRTTTQPAERTKMPLGGLTDARASLQL